MRCTQVVLKRKLKRKQHLEKKRAGRAVGGAAGGAAEGGRQRPGCHHFRGARGSGAGNVRWRLLTNFDDDDYEDKSALFVTFRLLTLGTNINTQMWCYKTVYAT